ncbi:DUF3784 domain-containing protein [Cytobacillus horneckiae]|uniref:DUF3784 domain-containing protein n=1 Tax=Cytobacillus horneckiae TaxID=549687 RepID=UPI003D9A976C
MAAVIVIQLVIAILFIILGWVIRFKGIYGLISGFNTRSEAEQQELIEKGYPQKTGSLIFFTGIGMILLFPITFSSFAYANEVIFGFMLIFLLGGMIYLSKFEIHRKKKRSYIISLSLFIIIVGGIAAITAFSYQGYTLKTTNSGFEITGMYGEEWDYANVVNVELMDSLPDVTWRQNGVGLPTLSKGYFKVEGYGSSLLFIQHQSPPYLYIETDERPIFINDKDPSVTKKWYEEINDNVQ